jgi:hypothetical protein
MYLGLIALEYASYKGRSVSSIEPRSIVSNQRSKTIGFSFFQFFSKPNNIEDSNEIHIDIDILNPSYIFIRLLARERLR